MTLKLDCKQVSRMLSEGLDEKLDAPERARMRLHLVICQACRNVDEQLAFMRRAIQALGQDRRDAIVPPPAKDGG
jgi:predicted anti-sigma-YlaC factor YlaD